MTILCIETSNKTLSLALGEENKSIATYTSQVGSNHSLTLMPAVDFLVSENQLKPKELTKVIVAKGPGSYTGLRIGVTTAKTLSWTLNIPLYAVSTLALIASNVESENQLIVPLIDARRQNVFTGAYRWTNGQLVSVIEDKYISLEDWLIELSQIDESIWFVSEDISKLSEQLEPFIERRGDKLSVKAVNASQLLDIVSESDLVEDIESFVPTYLKRVEAEEKWLENQDNQELDDTDYVTRIE